MRTGTPPEICAWGGGGAPLQPEICAHTLFIFSQVCLSILGTWRGETAEIWRSSYSLTYILSAVQSLIMNGKPYHNEPGYEADAATKMSEGDECPSRDPEVQLVVF